MAHLASVASLLQSDTKELLGPVDGVSFKPQLALHMTFVFFKEDLHHLPEQELRDLHKATRGEIEKVADAAFGAALDFVQFELFPPGKVNQVAALFRPSRPLVELRHALLERLRWCVPSLPARFWSDIRDDGEWLPHITLGKIGATTEQIGRLSCGSALCRIAPARARSRGLTLLGELPKRAWLNWLEDLSFVGPCDDPVDGLLELSLEEALAERPRFRRMFDRGSEEEQDKWRQGWTFPDAAMQEKLRKAHRLGIF